MGESYDVIVVGGGSAGCVAAARLSEDPDRSVLLLERGPDPRPIPEVVADPAKARLIRTDTPYISRYPTKRTYDGSAFDSLAARVMGGGSTINLMSITRPIRADFDAWAGAGNPIWSWEHTLPVLKRMETDREFPDHPLHGGSGPLFFQRRLDFNRPLEGLEKALVEGATALGLPLCPDQNSPDPFGVALSVAGIKDGRRQTPVDAYLDPARSRNNLHVVAEAQVLSVEVEGDRVTAVRYEKGGRVHSASGQKIVLCAGVYHSPQILMLSGIGPAAELERHGIPAVHALEGVGYNLQDHASVTLEFEGAKPHREDWLVPGVLLDLKSRPDRPHLDLHVFIRPPISGNGQKLINPITAHLLEQRTRGRVFLNTADPKAPPGIETGLMEDPEDIEAMVSAMRFVERLAQTGPMKEYYGPLLKPTADEDWTTYAGSRFDSFRHGVGTCSMGPASNGRAVVDERLRVHGLPNLWVADASVLPVVPHAHTNLAAMMVGERLADFFNE